MLRISVSLAGGDGVSEMQGNETGNEASGRPGTLHLPRRKDPLARQTLARCVHRPGSPPGPRLHLKSGEAYEGLAMRRLRRYGQDWVGWCLATRCDRSKTLQRKLVRHEGLGGQANLASLDCWARWPMTDG